MLMKTNFSLTYILITDFYIFESQIIIESKAMNQNIAISRNPVHWPHLIMCMNCLHSHWKWHQGTHTKSTFFIDIKMIFWWFIDYFLTEIIVYIYCNRICRGITIHKFLHFNSQRNNCMKCVQYPLNFLRRFSSS